MNDELKNDVVNLLKTLKQDAEMALDGRWDKSDEGFDCQIFLINRNTFKHR
jgi:hypothetical protein